MGCLRKLVLLVVLVALGAWAYMNRDRIMERFGKKPPPRETAPTIAWEPTQEEAAGRARKAIESLGQKKGPVFANVRAGELVSYLEEALARQLPPSTSDIAGAVVGDRLYVRASISLDDIHAVETLGPLAAIFNKRETVVFGGTMSVVKPELGEFRVLEVKVRDFSVPQTVITKLMRQVFRGDRPAGIADNGVPVPLPAYIGDVRVAQGRVTLYKSVP